ncbi:MAG: ATP-binding protein [Bacteroidia bacterium]|nr:ATP-binding protein [Bacteroidia bacterium]
MLISFSVSNFRSISEKQTFSLQTVGKVREFPKNVIKLHDTELLRSVIIYGRNASGKSNLLLAMDTLKKMVTIPEYELSQAYNPNKLNISKLGEPVWFELVYIADDGIKYKYDLSFDSKIILTESLYYYPEKKPSKLFVREAGKKISLGNSFQDNITDIEEKLYPHDTFLSRVAFHKIDSLVIPYTFFTRHFITHSFSLQEKSLLEHFQNCITNGYLPHHLENVSKLLRVADTGIKSLEIKDFKEEEFNFPPDMDEKTRKRIVNKNRFKVYFNHDIFDNNDNVVDSVKFNIDEESAGTIKLLSLGSIMLDCLNDGDVLFVDELDKSLHPKLTRALINIFNDQKTNPKDAQLIFVSHDVSLLNSGLFRRDQIWLADKDLKGNTEYYSIADFKGVRMDIPLEKHYMNGTFRGTPVINDYDFEFDFTENGK